MHGPDEEALDDHPDRLIVTDPSCGPRVQVSLEEFEELDLSCETWEEPKRFDRRLAAERARRAAA